MKVYCDANLPCGQSHPCLYFDLCFHQAVIPKGGRKPGCSGYDAGSRDSVQLSTPGHLERLQEMGAKRIRMKPKERAAETQTKIKKRDQQSDLVKENR